MWREESLTIAVACGKSSSAPPSQVPMWQSLCVADDDAFHSETEADAAQLKGYLPRESVLEAANCITDFAAGLIGLAFALSLASPVNLPATSFAFPFSLLSRALDPILVHGLPPIPVIDGGQSIEAFNNIRALCSARGGFEGELWPQLCSSFLPWCMWMCLRGSSTCMCGFGAHGR